MPITASGQNYTYADPQSWEFSGADWDAPDPTKTDYWRALYRAILERRDALQTVSYTIGNLLPLAAPYCPHEAEAIGEYRAAILDLVPHFVDAEKTVEKWNEYAQLPVSADNVPDHFSEAPVYFTKRDFLNEFSAFRDVPTACPTPASLSAFLLDSRAILDRLTVVPWGALGLVRERSARGIADVYDFDWGQSEAIASAKEAVAEEMGETEETVYRMDPAETYFADAVVYVSDDTGGGCEAVAEKQEMGWAIADPNKPARNVLGNPREPSLSAFAYSTKSKTRVEGIPIEEEHYHYFSSAFEIGYTVQPCTMRTAFGDCAEYPDAQTDHATSNGAVTRVFRLADFGNVYAFHGETEPPSGT